MSRPVPCQLGWDWRSETVAPSELMAWLVRAADRYPTYQGGSHNRPCFLEVMWAGGRSASRSMVEVRADISAAYVLAHSLMDLGELGESAASPLRVFVRWPDGRRWRGWLLHSDGMYTLGCVQ